MYVVNTIENLHGCQQTDQYFLSVPVSSSPIEPKAFIISYINYEW